MPRLRRVDCSEPGIRRIRRGRGFSFREEDGTPVDDAETLERINELAIPPAWTDVWICPYPNGHLQATGFDDAGRKQYRYHDFWRSKKDREKHEEMLEFARRLPAMRRRVEKDLKLRGFVRDRVLACSVRLLDRGFFRIGTEQYSNGDNESFGLATLRKRHVTFERGHVVFDYRAKGSKRHQQELADPEVIKVLKPLVQRNGGGHELLAYREGRSEWRDIKSADINEYLKEVMDGDFSAKDFRTWNATVIAAVGLAQDEAEAAKSKTARKRVANRVVKTVASYLGNTPAVCRASYIDPRVFDCFDSGTTISKALAARDQGDRAGRLPRSRGDRGGRARPAQLAAARERHARRCPCREGDLRPHPLGHRGAGGIRPCRAVDAAAGVGARAREEQSGQRRLRAAGAGGGAEDQLLVDLRRPRVHGAADEVAIGALEPRRAVDVAAADQIAEARGEALDLLLHPLGEDLPLALIPAAGEAVIAAVGLHVLGHVRVGPRTLLARGSPARLEARVLAEDEERPVRDQASG